MYLPGKPAFDFFQTPLQSFCLWIQEKSISKWISCNLKHACWAFLNLCNCSVASAEARMKEHSPSWQSSKLRVQCAVTADEQCRIRDKLVSVCVLPLSSFSARHASLCRNQFLLWCQNPTAQYVVHTKAEEAKKEEGKQTEEDEDKKCSLECYKSDGSFVLQRLPQEKQLVLGKQFQKDSAVVFKSDLAPTS